MNKFLSIAFILIFFQSCRTIDIGSVQIISNDEINFNQQYVLIKQNVVGHSKTTTSEALSSAIKDAITKYKYGVYLKNAHITKVAKIYTVTGDLYGYDRPDNKERNLIIGDQVLYRDDRNRLVTGTILEFKHDSVMVRTITQSRMLHIDAVNRK